MRMTQTPCRSVVCPAASRRKAYQPARSPHQGHSTAREPICPLFDPEGFREARERLGLAQAWGDYLRRYTWAHWLTLTTCYAMSADRLLWEFKELYVRRVSRAARQPVPYFAVVERGTGGSRLHLHALIGGTAHAEMRWLQCAWKRGLTSVEQYDPGLGAAWYISKTMIGSWDAYELSRRIPLRIARVQLELTPDAADGGHDDRETRA